MTFSVPVFLKGSDFARVDDAVWLVRVSVGGILFCLALTHDEYMKKGGLSRRRRLQESKPGVEFMQSRARDKALTHGA